MCTGVQLHTLYVYTHRDTYAHIYYHVLVHSHIYIVYIHTV